MAPTADLLEAYMEHAGPRMMNVLKGAWIQYIGSSQKGAPYIVIPKELADDMGNDVLYAMAHRFCVITAAKIDIRFDPINNIHYIGPPQCLPINHALCSTMVSIYYAPGSMAVPDMTGSLPRNRAAVPATKPVKVTKTANCFMLYRKDKQEELRLANPSMLCKELSVIIGQMWAQETSEVRRMYQIRADELRGPAVKKDKNKAMLLLKVPNGLPVAIAPLAVRAARAVRAAPAVLVAPIAVQAAPSTVLTVPFLPVNVPGTALVNDSIMHRNRRNPELASQLPVYTTNVNGVLVDEFGRPINKYAHS